MKPSQSMNEALVWRFREIGIEIRSWRDTRNWGGWIAGDKGRRTLPIDTLSFLITTLGLEAQIPCA